MQKRENAGKTKQNQALLDGPELHQGMWETLVKPSGIKLFCMLRTRAGTLQNSLKRTRFASVSYISRTATVAIKIA